MFCEIPEFGRCCFCLPLRRGVLVFGYLNILFSGFMIGVYSYYENKGGNQTAAHLVFHGVASESISGLCIALYCLEVVMNAVLLYGAHQKLTMYIKMFYYYAVTTTVACLILQVVEFANIYFISSFFELGAFAFVGLCLQLYLIFLVHSLLKKLDMSGPHVYVNRLHQVVTGEQVDDHKTHNPAYNVPNGIYKDSTVEIY